MLVRSCFLITLIKCLKGHKSLVSLFLCQLSKSWVSQWQGHLLSCSGQLKTCGPKWKLGHVLQLIFGILFARFKWQQTSSEYYLCLSVTMSTFFAESSFSFSTIVTTWSNHEHNHTINHRQSQRKEFGRHLLLVRVCSLNMHKGSTEMKGSSYHWL